MREAFLLLRRGPLPVAVIAVAVLVGVLNADATSSPSGALAAAADAGPRLLLPLALALAAWTMSPDADNNLARERQALSLPDAGWTAARTAALIAACWTLLACFLLASLVSALLKPDTHPLSTPAVGRPLALAVLSATLFGLWSSALLRGRRSLPALSTCLAVILVTVTIAFAPRGGTGDLARSVWPLAALRVIAGGNEGAAPSLGLIAVLSVSLATAASLWALTRPDPRLRARTVRTGHAATPYAVAGAIAATSLVAGTALPTLLTSALPWSSRPATVIQQLSGTDPASQAQAFLQALWTHNTAVADSLTTQPTATQVIGHYTPLVGARPATMQVHTVTITNTGTARVQADGFAQTVALCMTRHHNAWLVAALTTTPQCP